MRAAATDGNQASIVAALRKAGAKVWSLHRVGGGVGDLLVAFRGKTTIGECKGEKGKRNALQIAFAEEMADVGVEVPLWKTPEQALKSIGAIK